jgi:hypothetical protein
MTDRAFDVRSPKFAPFGLIGWLFMGAILGGIPLMGLLIVLVQLGASDPVTTLIVSLVCTIPIAILYTLHRLFTKFRLSILLDGTVEYIQPFKTSRFAVTQIATAGWSSTHVAAANRRVSWLILGDAAGKKLEAISPISFDEAALQEFVAKLQTLNPNLRVSS